VRGQKGALRKRLYGLRIQLERANMDYYWIGVRGVLFGLALVWSTVYALAWYFTPQDTHPLPVAFIEISLIALSIAWYEAISILKKIYHSLDV